MADEGLTINTSELKEVGDSNEFDISEDDHQVSSSGRDSGISNDYKKDLPISPLANSQPSNELINQVEEQLQNIVFSSQKELYDAKQKLEDLRIVRFEEKSKLEKEVELWKGKLANEETQTKTLNEKCKDLESEKQKLVSDYENLLKEKSVANEINMMQEQEIVRLEMKLKSNEIEYMSLNKQIEQQRKMLLEKDKTRIRQQDELSRVSIKLQSMEESLNFYKTQSRDNESKLGSKEREICQLEEQLADTTAEMELSRDAENKSRQHVKHMQNLHAELRDEVESLKLQIREEREENNILQLRFENKESELNGRLQYLENSIETKEIHHENELKRKEKALKDVELRLQEVIDERDYFQRRLHEIQVTLKRHMKRDMLKVYISPIETEDASTQYISCEDIDKYFTSVSSKLRNVQLELDDVTNEKKSKTIHISDLNATIAGLKSDLETVHDNLSSVTKKKDGIDEKYDRLNETFQIQERDIQRKSEENISLRKLVERSKEQIAKLQKELNIIREEKSDNETLFREEKQRLRIKLSDLQTKLDNLEKERSNESSKYYHEKISLEENLRKTNAEVSEKEIYFSNALEEKENEMKDLRNQLNALIEDNKNLAQRLIHLESYSEKLTSLLEVHQNEKEDIKKRFEIDSKEFGEILDGKHQELESLLERINKLNSVLVEDKEKLEKSHNKIKTLKDENKKLLLDNQTMKSQNKKLSERLSKLNDTVSSSEDKVFFLTNEVGNIRKQFEDQKGQTDLLLIQIENHEREKRNLKDELDKCEKRAKMKENLITEMAKKSTSTMEGYNSLKKKLDRLETVEREKASEMKILDQERLNLERSLAEKEHENEYLADQIKNLHKTLYRTEDEKERSIEELANTQRKLETVRVRNEKILNEARENMKQKDRMNEMQSQIEYMKGELDHEKRQREKLEDLHHRKFDQVAKLKSSFNQSLNTLTSDTKNIKKLLGKSLEKLDKQIRGVDDFESPSDVQTDTDKESVISPEKENKYFELPERSFHARKSYDSLKDWKRYSYSDIPERDNSDNYRKAQRKKFNISKMTP